MRALDFWMWLPLLLLLTAPGAKAGLSYVASYRCPSWPYTLTDDGKGFKGDFYALALDWSGSCTDGRCNADGVPLDFLIHGLWPNCEPLGPAGAPPHNSDFYQLPSKVLSPVNQNGVPANWGIEEAIPSSYPLVVNTPIPSVPLPQTLDAATRDSWVTKLVPPQNAEPAPYKFDNPNLYFLNHEAMKHGSVIRNNVQMQSLRQSQQSLVNVATAVHGQAHNSIYNALVAASTQADVDAIFGAGGVNMMNTIAKVAAVTATYVHSKGRAISLAADRDGMRVSRDQLLKNAVSSSLLQVTTQTNLGVANSCMPLVRILGGNGAGKGLSAQMGKGVCEVVSGSNVDANVLHIAQGINTRIQQGRTLLQVCEYAGARASVAGKGAALISACNTNFDASDAGTLANVPGTCNAAITGAGGAASVAGNGVVNDSSRVAASFCCAMVLVERLPLGAFGSVVLSPSASNDAARAAGAVSSGKTYVDTAAAMSAVSAAPIAVQPDSTYHFIADTLFEQLPDNDGMIGSREAVRAAAVAAGQAAPVDAIHQDWAAAAGSVCGHGKALLAPILGKGASDIAGTVDFIYRGQHGARGSSGMPASMIGAAVVCSFAESTDLRGAVVFDPDTVTNIMYAVLEEVVKGIAQRLRGYQQPQLRTSWYLQNSAVPNNVPQQTADAAQNQVSQIAVAAFQAGVLRAPRRTPPEPPFTPIGPPDYMHLTMDLKSLRDWRGTLARTRPWIANQRTFTRAEIQAMFTQLTGGHPVAFQCDNTNHLATIIPCLDSNQQLTDCSPNFVTFTQGGCADPVTVDFALPPTLAQKHAFFYGPAAGAVAPATVTTNGKRPAQIWGINLRQTELAGMTVAMVSLAQSPLKLLQWKMWFDASSAGGGLTGANTLFTVSRMRLQNDLHLLQVNQDLRTFMNTGFGGAPPGYSLWDLHSINTNVAVPAHGVPQYQFNAGGANQDVDGWHGRPARTGERSSLLVVFRPGDRVRVMDSLPTQQVSLNALQPGNNRFCRVGSVAGAVFVAAQEETLSFVTGPCMGPTGAPTGEVMRYMNTVVGSRREVTTFSLTSLQAGQPIPAAQFHTCNFVGGYVRAMDTTGC